jgi:hypothetical protein
MNYQSKSLKNLFQIGWMNWVKELGEKFGLQKSAQNQPAKVLSKYTKTKKKFERNGI